MKINLSLTLIEYFSSKTFKLKSFSFNLKQDYILCSVSLHAELNYLRQKWLLNLFKLLHLYLSQTHFCKRTRLFVFCFLFFERAILFPYTSVEYEVCFLTKNICLLCLFVCFLPNILSYSFLYASQHLFKKSQEIYKCMTPTH